MGSKRGAKFGQILYLRASRRHKILLRLRLSLIPKIRRFLEFLRAAINLRRFIYPNKRKPASKFSLERGLPPG